jgi:hypothetical protein
MLTREWHMGPIARALSPLRAGLTAAAGIGLVIGAGLATPAVAAQTAGHTATAAASGVRFGYPDGGHVVVNPSCSLSAKGSIPEHDGEFPSNVSNGCKYWLDLYSPLTASCLPVNPGTTSGVPRSANSWFMSEGGLCTAVPSALR